MDPDDQGGLCPTAPIKSGKATGSPAERGFVRAPGYLRSEARAGIGNYVRVDGRSNSGKAMSGGEFRPGTENAVQRRGSGPGLDGRTGMIPPWPDGESHTHPDAPVDHWLTTLKVRRRPTYGGQAGLRN